MSLILTSGTVYVIDDEKPIKDSLQWLLTGNGYNVICYESAEDFIKYHNPNEIACLLCDVRLPGMSGIELLDRLKVSHSPIPIALMSGHGSVPMAVSSIQKGASDFLLKPFSVNDLLEVVQRLSNKAKHTFDQHNKTTNKKRLWASLTARENQVLELIVKGRLNKQIAEDLGISEKTVETHRKSIMKKLDAKNAAHLLTIALG